MGAGEGEGVFRVRGRLGQELTAQAGNRDWAGALSPPQQEWVVNSSCHRPLCPGRIASSEPSAGGGARLRTRRLGRASLAKHGAPVTDPKYPRKQCLALEPLDSDQVAQIRDLPGMSGGRRGRTQTQVHLRSQLPTTELSNKMVCRPDPAPPRARWGARACPRVLSAPTPFWQVHLQADPEEAANPAGARFPLGLRAGAGRTRAACPLQVPRRPRKRAATARHTERRSRGGEGKGRENRSGANSHRAGDSAPASRAPPLRLALPGLVRLYSRVACIARPNATCPPAAPPPRAWPRRSRALGPGRSPFRPAPVTQHPS